MSEAAESILTAFDELAPSEQHRVAIEILRRSAASDELSEATLTELADELFRSYDAEEAANADSPR